MFLDQDQYYPGELKGKHGLVPSNFVAEISKLKSDSEPGWLS